MESIFNYSFYSLRRVVRLMALFMVALASVSAQKSLSAANGSDDKRYPVAVIEIDANEVLREELPENYLGFNIRWERFQRDLWDSEENHVKDRILDALKPFTGAMYRYPGGLVANEYIWEQSVLPLQQRKRLAASVPRSERPPLFGVHEFYDFVKQVKGSPLYTLNIVGKGKPSRIEEYSSAEMAESNRLLAKYIMEQTPGERIRYYQLGNELDRNHYEWSHEKYIARSRDTIEAMQSVDPDARFIAFLREFNWRYRGGKKGISKSEDLVRDVLTELPMVNDFSLHFYYDGEIRPGGRFMHIQDVVDRVQRTLSVAEELREPESIGVWITEHSRRLIVTKKNERMAKTYTSNLQAALSTADFLTAMTQIPQVKGTGLQALNGVGRQVFDASVRHADLRPRPVYWAMRILNYGGSGAVHLTDTKSPHTSGYPGGYDVRAAALSNGTDELTVWVVNRAQTAIDSDIVYLPFKGQVVEMQHYYLAGDNGVNADEAGDNYHLQTEPVLQEAKFSNSGVLSVRLPPSSVSSFLLQRKEVGK